MTSDDEKLLNLFDGVCMATSDGGERRVSWYGHTADDRVKILRRFLSEVADAAPKPAQHIELAKRIGAKIANLFRTGFFDERMELECGRAALECISATTGKFLPLTAGYDLPEGYRLGCDGSSFWVLRGVEYISNTTYPTAIQAERAAWKHAYEKQAELIRDIRQIALRAL